MSTATGNIFFTVENLAFSLPLIVVCGTYVSLTNQFSFIFVNGFYTGSC
jgi:hypothetical protein